jgi:hypothetical protein
MGWGDVAKSEIPERWRLGRDGHRATDGVHAA